MAENKNNSVNQGPEKNNNTVMKVVIAIVAIAVIVFVAMKFMPKANDSNAGTNGQVESTQGSETTKAEGTQATEGTQAVEGTQTMDNDMDPVVAEYIDYLENTKIRDAVALYGEKIYDNPEHMEAIRTELLDRIEKVEEAYKDGSMEYTESLNKLRDYGTFRELATEMNAARDRIKEMNKDS
ncbi:MAG: hypothetical protein GX833_01525 [Clostridium sp.]|nr:hypothetical protein [Clostridium sp.]